jgi:carbamoyl-phosphate synthase large subunit
LNVLISSAGRRGALVRIFQKSIQEMFGAGHVVAVDASPLSAAGRLADHFEIVPHCLSERFLPHMLELCQRWCIAAVIPTIDTELAVYAANRKAFAGIGTSVLVSSPETIEIGADKNRLHGWLVQNNFPTVRTALLGNVLADPSGWEFPLMVKPARGSASVGVVRADSWYELEKRETEPGLIVQALAMGQEYTVDVWINCDGTCSCAVPRRRLEVRAGEVQKAVTVRWPELENLARDVATALPGAYGAINIQIFADEDNFAIIEINPRFGGGYPLSWQAGADFPRWFLEDVSGFPKAGCPAEWKSGMVMLRFDDAVFIDAATARI